jgi:hypothetical protein
MIDSATMRAFFIYKDKGMVSKHLLPYVKDFEIFLADELLFIYLFIF